MSEEQSRSNLYLSLLCVLAALITIFIWVPMDTGTGLVEKVRRQVTIGDALAPTVASAFVLIGGLIVLVFERRDPEQGCISAANLKYLASLAIIVVGAFLVVRYAGVILAGLANILDGGERSYRLLRDTAPWKYTGFFLGGSLLAAGLIIYCEGRYSARSILVAIIIVSILIVILDLPFDDLLLPPNGDF